MNYVYCETIILNLARQEGEQKYKIIRGLIANNAPRLPDVTSRKAGLRTALVYKAAS